MQVTAGPATDPLEEVRRILQQEDLADRVARGARGPLLALSLATHTALGRLLTLLDLCWPPRRPLSEPGPDGTRLVVTRNMPPRTTGWTLGQVVAMTPERHADCEARWLTLIHEYVHVLQFRAGMTLPGYLLRNGAWNHTPGARYEGPALAIEALYRAHPDLPPPWALAEDLSPGAMPPA